MGTTTINKTNGDILTTITDGAAEDGVSSSSSTNLALIGRLYKNYGELVNENFVKLLENFANSTSPSKPVIGQIWYDTTNKILKYYTGTGFVTIARMTSSNAEPGNSLTGDFWYDTADNQLKMRTLASSWLIISPQYTTSQGKTGTFAENIVDSSNGNHVCIVHYQSGVVTAIECKDPSWSPKLTITGFTTVISGYNLAEINDQKFNGTAVNSEKLGGINADMYALKTGGELSGALYLPNAGAYIGNAQDLHIYRDGGVSKFKTTTGQFQFITNTDTALTITQDEQSLFASGTASVPSISFGDDPNSGLWSPMIGQVNLSIGGTSIVGFTSSDMTVNGNIAATGFSGTINSTSIVNSGNVSVGGTVTTAFANVTGTLTTGNLITRGITTIGDASTDIVYLNASNVIIGNGVRFNGGDVTATNDLYVNGEIAGQNGTANVVVRPGLDVSGGLRVTGTAQITALDVASTFAAGTNNMLELDGANRLKLNSASVADGYNSSGDFTMGATNVIRSFNTAKFWVAYRNFAPLLIDSHNIAAVVKAGSNNYAFSLFTSPAFSSAGLALVGSNSVRFQSAPEVGSTSFAVFTLVESSLMGLAIYSA